MSVISALAILICSAIGIRMLMGQETLTNLEALAGLLFLGWFIVFSSKSPQSRPIVCTIS